MIWSLFTFCQIYSWFWHVGHQRKGDHQGQGHDLENDLPIRNISMMHISTGRLHSGRLKFLSYYSLEINQLKAAWISGTSNDDSLLFRSGTKWVTDMKETGIDTTMTEIVVEIGDGSVNAIHRTTETAIVGGQSPNPGRLQGRNPKTGRSVCPLISGWK